MPATDAAVLSVEVSAASLAAAEKACSEMGLPPMAECARLFVEALADGRMRPVMAMALKGPMGAMVRAGIEQAKCR